MAGTFDTITAGGRTIVTWLTPYAALWETHVGAIAMGRLAKAFAPARTLLGDATCLSAFTAYVTAHADKKAPEWFARECRQWAAKAEASTEPLVSATGTLTDRGRKVYEGRA